MNVDPHATLVVRLGQRIAQLRIAALLTQAELADRAEMARTDLVRRENGLGSLASLKTVMRLARALDVEPSEILCVLDSRWCFEQAWRLERLSRGTMAHVARPLGAS